MKIELCDVLYNGEEIIGYSWNVVPFLEQMVKDLVNDFLENDMNEEELATDIKNLKEIIDTLKKNEEDYDLVKICECPMGGFLIKKLEEC